MNNLVTITIPTFNSAKTLGKCLESIKQQDYKNIEVTIVDSYSKDNTVEIAKNFGAKIYRYKGTLLGARDIGVKKAKGKFILLLDSDQILEKTAINRALKLFKIYDMLWLEERTYKPYSFLERLFDADRILIQKHPEQFISPLGGVILARFFKKELIKKAFQNIPKKIMPLCVAHDHAIIYYEAYKISKNIGKLPKAVWHIEPSSLIHLWKKTYRYGKTTKELVRNKAYIKVIESKMRFRKFYIKDFSLSFKSFLLRVLRSIPHRLGYYLSS